MGGTASRAREDSSRMGVDECASRCTSSFDLKFLRKSTLSSKGSHLSPGSRTSTKYTNSSISEVSSNDSQRSTFLASSESVDSLEFRMSREVTPNSPQSIDSSEVSPSFALHRDKGPEADKGQPMQSREQEVGETAGPPHAPKHLHAAFKPEEIRPWEEGRFKHIQKLNDAPRNEGAVHLAHDSLNNELVAIKQMPNAWLLNSHEAFVRTRPTENELPWQDLGVTRFLNSVNFKYACKLEGVYRSRESTFVASSFASEGDLFDVALGGIDPSPDLEREALLAPIVCQLFTGLKQLHDMQIVHRDISLENVLLTKSSRGYEVKIIDYSMASTDRVFPCSAATLRGKQSYQAPEMHFEKSYDAFLSEVFAAGVLVYTLFLKDYVWQSTVPGECKNFEFIDKYGFREFCARRRVRGSDLNVAQCASSGLLELLDGMLSLDPRRRLTFGEKEWTDRRSVWDEPWMSLQL